MLRKLQCATVMHERFAHQAAPLIDLGQGANSGEVAGRRIEDECQLGEGVVKSIELDERAAERDPRRQVVRMMNEAGAADAHRFFVRAGAPALFSELRKNNRRRVRLDPASKLENVWLVCHVPVSVVERPPAVRHCRRYGAGGATLTDWLATENTPASSVTFRVTM